MTYKNALLTKFLLDLSFPGWTKIEVLLQHLYDDECSLTETLSHAADSTPNMPELKKRERNIYMTAHG